jgi:phage anti-repressor protein
MEAFNEEIVNNNISITIIEYIKEANNRYYQIDISFMEEFINLVERNDYCIPHTTLIKYGILSDKNISSDTNRLLEQYGFKENIDYLLCNVAEQVPSGTKYKNEYLLKPDTFKLCLIGSIKTRKYAKYYILLERCINYYNKYQIELKNNKIKYLNIENLSLSDKIDKQSAKIDKQSDEIHQLLGTTRNIQDDLHDLTDMVFDYSEQNKTLKVENNIATSERINNPKNKNDIEQFVILRVKDNIENYKYKYRTIRGTTSYIKIKTRQYTGLTFNKDWSIKNSNNINKDYEFVKIYNDVPNARHLFRAIKERNLYCINEYNVEFNIIIQEHEVLQIFQEIFDSRLTIEIEEREQKEIKRRSKYNVIKNIKQKKVTK